MFADQLTTAIATASLNALDQLSRTIWQGHATGAIADDQAQELAEQILSRRRAPGHGGLMSATTHLVSIAQNRIQRSPEQRSPDRQASIARRREHAATGPLPPKIAAGFTTGELAVLRIVADEWLAHGACDRSINELAARAGTCRALAKRTIRLAELDCLITVTRRPRSGRKHLTNIVQIIRAEWLDWLRKGHRRAFALQACARAKPDFATSRGVEKNPPRSQVFRKRLSGKTTGVSPSQIIAHHQHGTGG